MGDRSTQDLTGQRLGHFRVDGVIGRGGMSVLYRATDTRLGRRVALKVIDEALAADREFRERFVDEARNTSAVDHAHVVPLYDFDETDGHLYIAMRHVEGPDLASVIDGRPLTVARTLRLLGQVADALDAVHARGLVHLDVKPANVLVTTRESAGEHVYLADFGLTRRGATGHRTSGGDFLGSPTYAAPEHLRGEPVDARTDVYSLTCVLFTCLTGRAPYLGSVTEVIDGHLAGEVPSVADLGALDPRVDDVIHRGMDPDRPRRHGSASAVIEAARGALTGPGPAPLVGPGPGAGAGPARRPVAGARPPSGPGGPPTGPFGRGVPPVPAGPSGRGAPIARPVPPVASVPRAASVPPAPSVPPAAAAPVSAVPPAGAVPPTAAGPPAAPAGSAGAGRNGRSGSAGSASSADEVSSEDTGRAAGSATETALPGASSTAAAADEERTSASPGAQGTSGAPRGRPVPPPTPPRGGPPATPPSAAPPSGPFAAPGPGQVFGTGSGPTPGGGRSGSFPAPPGAPPGPLTRSSVAPPMRLRDPLPPDRDGSFTRGGGPGPRPVVLVIAGAVVLLLVVVLVLLIV
ncbi:serine/threonine-protein kinase [Actinomycetospora lemnae]|uniref:non-specific serine/threonine protein kinase n=1 Tax=Actinomycetospora lemnae TaxID=3019891 RepID=A0ABT5SWS7_9PSEU|nr:serine/threonine-protein kinase [Actinomycetospora sp. DW7H6]MDD7967318.1 serine/threonine-protein kinase [Actinomycetospora sp. DW7H6]